MAKNPPLDREFEVMLADVVREILTGRASVGTIDAQADQHGYSRAHWSRMFARYMGEPPRAFARRIGLERAASLLATTTDTVDAVGKECGYENPSAFCRAFRAQFGVTPGEYRANPPAPPTTFSGVHWVREWSELPAEEEARLRRRYPIQLRILAESRWAVRDYFGSYSRIGEFLEDFVARHPEARSRQLGTIYHDNMWTYPSSQGMRSQIGYRLANGEEPVEGLDLEVLPGGTYATFDSPLARRDRNEGWAWMSGQSFQGVSFDEYEGCPLPWEESRTRVWAQVR